MKLFLEHTQKCKRPGSEMRYRIIEREPEEPGEANAPAFTYLQAYYDDHNAAIGELLYEHPLEDRNQAIALFYNRIAYHVALDAAKNDDEIAAVEERMSTYAMKSYRIKLREPVDLDDF